MTDDSGLIPIPGATVVLRWTDPVVSVLGRPMEAEIGLVPEPVEMEPLVATGTRSRRLEIKGVYERRHWGELLGLGTFITAAGIEVYRGPASLPAELGGGRGSRLFRDEEWYVLDNRLGLSPREAEIVRLVFDDLSKTEIARRMGGLAPSTIHTYLGRLYRKVGVKSRGELMTFVFLEFLEGRASRSLHQ